MVIDATTQLDLGGRMVELMPTPGHSAGSISLWDETTRAAITADAVLGDGLHFADGRPAFPPTYRNLRPYHATVATLQELRPEWLLTAHEPVMDAAASGAFRKLSRSFTDRFDSFQNFYIFRIILV